MTELVFSVVLLVLAAAIVVLFAMFGELTARLPNLNAGYLDPKIVPLDEARLGSTPKSRPAPLRHLAEVDDGAALLLVLSTACASCEGVGRQLAAARNGSRSKQPGILVSCADAHSGNEFIQRHALENFPTYVDEGGAWVSSSFGVQHSPTGLLIRGGRLESALIFTDLSALWATVHNNEGGRDD